MSEKIDLQKIADELDFDLEDVEMLLEVFLESATESFADLKDGIESNNFETIFRAAHAIKGSASNLTLHEIAATAKELETTARAEISVNYQEYYDKLKLLVDHISN